MTEKEWMECTDPMPMLEFLTEEASKRKCRLFGVAGCRRWWHLLDVHHCKKLVEVGVPLGCEDLESIPLESCRNAIEMAERAADEQVPSEELSAISQSAFAFQFPAEYYCACFGSGPFDGELVASGEAAFAAHYASWPDAAIFAGAAGVVWNTAQAAGFVLTKEFGPPNEAGMAAERRCQCDLLRDIFGNPMRPTGIKASWLTTNNVLSLAEFIYANRTFDQMPELADSLERAGCTNQDVLLHCRQQGNHVRGCWVVDKILGKQ
jgi:hypothetical protein